MSDPAIRTARDQMRDAVAHWTSSELFRGVTLYMHSALNGRQASDRQEDAWQMIDGMTDVLLARTQRMTWRALCARGG